MSMMPVHEMPVVASPTFKTIQSQDDWEIGRKHAVRPSSSSAGVPNISDNEKIDHKVICAVISGHMRHGIRIGQREKCSIYDIEDLPSAHAQTGTTQIGDEVCCVGGTPTEVEFDLQLTAQAPNHCGICRCRLAVLPAGSLGGNDKDADAALMELIFDASAEEPLHFHITSSHFDSNSSYSVALNWVLPPRPLW